MLIVSGEREDTRDYDSPDFTSHISERSYGKFERRVRLPLNADQEKVEAGMENGVLRVKFGKKALVGSEAGVKKITIG